jgi:hypothetical protein
MGPPAREEYHKADDVHQPRAGVETSLNAARTSEADEKPFQAAYEHG